MKAETFLFGIFVATVACLGAVVLILTSISPQDAGMAGLGAFFASLFGAVFGLCVLVGFLIRRRLSGGSASYDNVSVSLRQGLLVALAAVGLLMLQSLRVLSAFSAVLFVLVIFSGEIYLRRGAKR